jgi:hypothetical protein
MPFQELDLALEAGDEALGLPTDCEIIEVVDLFLLPR